MKEQVVMVRDVAFRYGNSRQDGEHVLQQVSFSLFTGEIICIVGPSGCGKTTLLHLIAGLLNPWQGNVLFPSARNSNDHKIGYIFQFDPLLPWRNVRGNLVLGLEVNGRHRAEVIDEEIADYLDTFNLDMSVLSKYPSELSGGMRQRVAIIQSLMYDPRLLLLDEPFASLDFYTKLRLEGEFWGMVKSRGKAAVLVTHDIDEAIALGDRVLVIGGNPARIVREFLIEFDQGVRSPDAVRGMSKFAEYFDAIWKELSSRLENE
jgi:NitT/TauT family transport system ATP-binding protein